MLEQFLDQLVMGLAGLFLIVVAPFLVRWLRAMEVKAIVACKSDYGDVWIGRVFDLAYETVNATFGTYVKDLKEKGIFTEAEQAEAFNRTKIALTNILAESIEDAKNAGISDVNALIDSAIESAVEKLKR